MVILGLPGLAFCVEPRLQGIFLLHEEDEMQPPTDKNLQQREPRQVHQARRLERGFCPCAGRHGCAKDGDATDDYRESRIA